jgi:hypothetical protein
MGHAGAREVGQQTERGSNIVAEASAHPEDALAVLLVPRDTAKGQLRPRLVADAENEDVARETRKARARRQLRHGPGVDLDGLRLNRQSRRVGRQGGVEAVGRSLRRRVDERRGV